MPLQVFKKSVWTKDEDGVWHGISKVKKVGEDDSNELKRSGNIGGYAIGNGGGEGTPSRRLEPATSRASGADQAPSSSFRGGLRNLFRSNTSKFMQNSHSSTKRRSASTSAISQRNPMPSDRDRGSAKSAEKKIPPFPLPSSHTTARSRHYPNRSVSSAAHRSLRASTTSHGHSVKTANDKIPPYPLPSSYTMARDRHYPNRSVSSAAHRSSHGHHGSGHGSHRSGYGRSSKTAY